MSADLVFVLSVLGAGVTAGVVFVAIMRLYEPWILRGGK